MIVLAEVSCFLIAAKLLCIESKVIFAACQLSEALNIHSPIYSALKRLLMCTVMYFDSGHHNWHDMLIGFHRK